MNQRKVLQSSIKTGSPIKYQNRFFNQVSKQVLQSRINKGSSIKESLHKRNLQSRNFYTFANLLTQESKKITTIK